MATLWHGRFEGGSNEALQALNDSLPFDRRMFRDDVAGSRAHVRMLARVGLMTEDDATAVLEALDATEAEMTDGSFTFQASDEDVHTAVERRVTELAGETIPIVSPGTRGWNVTSLPLYAPEGCGRSPSANHLGLP